MPARPEGGGGSRPLAMLAEELAALEAGGLGRRRRTLESAQGVELRIDGRQYLAFGSNDYLGLAAHPLLRAALTAASADAGVGAGASHLVTGHHALHARLEDALAAFVGAPRALLFSSGYLANLGIVQSLLGRHDTLYADRLNHACLNDGALLARARLARYPHLDVRALARMMAAPASGRRMIATDAVFSMDGDLAPLPELLALAQAHDALLVVDDAHGFGVLGRGGRGALEHHGLTAGGWPQHLVYMGTLGKAAGVAGAFVAAHETIVEWLVQRARTYVYTTALPPALAAAAGAALGIIEAEPERRARLVELADRLRARCAGLPWTLGASRTPIQPLIVGAAADALALAQALAGHGLLVPAIRPPTVPAGTARLRISLSAAHTGQHIDRLAAALHAIAAAPAPARAGPRPA
jgi:8-amino-7-oxononanoate synthase